MTNKALTILLAVLWSTVASAQRVGHFDSAYMLGNTPSNYVELKAPDAMSGTYALVLPPDDGTANQVLKTDGSGVTSWYTIPGLTLGDAIASATAGPIFYGGTGGTLAQASTFAYDATNGRLGIGTATPTNPLQLVHAGASGTAGVIQVTNTANSGNGVTIQHSGTGRGMLIQQTGTGTGRGIEITSTNAANTNPLAVLTGTHGGYGLTVTTNAGTAQNYTATFSNLSTAAAAPVSGGVYGSVRSTGSVLSAGVVGEVIGSGIGSGFFAVRNSAGTSIGLGTNLGAGVRISPQYAMSAGDNYALELPLVQGGAGTTMVNNGSGVLSWAAVPAAPSIGGTLTGSTTGRILFGGSGATFDDDSGLIYDDANNRVGIDNATPLFPIDIGRGSASEAEVLGFTFTGDPNYRNYISSANNGVSGANYLKFYLKDGPNPGYVSPMVLSDLGTAFTDNVSFQNDVGIHTGLGDTPLGSLEVVSADGAAGIVMSLSGDRARYATIKNNFNGVSDPDNKLRFYVQTAAASQVVPLTLDGAGNVGVGTETPIYKLDVAGSARISDGHIITSQSTGPAAVVTANAGTGATCSLGAESNDTVGTIELQTTATASSDGSQCDVTFDGGFGTNAPVCVFSPANAGAAEAPGIVAPFITSTSTTLSIEFVNAEAVGVSYAWSYHCVGID